MENSEFGLKIKGIRELSQLSQAAFADQIGVSKSKIQNIETGKQRVDHEFLRNLAVLFSVDITKLLLEDTPESAALDHLGRTYSAPRPQSDGPALSDLARLRLAVEAVEDSLDIMDRTASVENRAQLITNAYDLLEQDASRAMREVLKLTMKLSTPKTHKE
jgi:transcriptional regulator with XRE-family HTH domain